MQEQRRKWSGLGTWPKALITPCCLWGCSTLRFFPSNSALSQDTPQLTNHFAERLKPALDHKSCGQSSVQERACPWGPKTDLPSWSKQLQGGGCIPVPLQWDKPYPSTGAGQYSNYLREQKFSLQSLFHPRAACGFLTAATWPQKLPMRNTAFHVLHTRQLLWEGCFG